MKVALVYDWVCKIGGAERILAALHEIWPDAPLFTSVYNPKTAPWAKDFTVIPSFLQKFPWAKSKHELYPWLMPQAFESFNFDNYDVVISITSAEAKGIITKPQTLHICYCLTPTRYLWSHSNLYFKNPLLRIFSQPVVSYLKFWDKIASQRPDEYIAISQNVQKRIKRYYQREAKIIYPPVDTNRFKLAKDDKTESFFLIISRLVPYKRIDIAVDAFNSLKLPLKIIGTGSEERVLKKMAKSNIEFLGQLTDGDLLQYYQRCQALIFPQEEDFGLSAVEVQACGRPVIAYRGGGVLETIVEGKTGEFFYPQSAEALKETVRRFEFSKYKPKDCQKNAERFGKESFKEKFVVSVEELLANYKSRVGLC